MIRPQNEFPLLEEYAKHFELNDDVIFTLYPDIYTNNDLTPDLLIHENTHLKQQEKDGITNWVNRFLNEPEYRLKQELEAYRAQIRSIKDKNQRHRCRLWASETLSSGLYGNIINKKEAFELLK